MTRMRAALFVLSFLLVAPLAHAQATTTGASQNTEETEKAVVISIESSEIQSIPGTNTNENVQMLSAQVLEGSDKGQTVSVENDYVAMKPGDVFFLTHETGGGVESYVVEEPDRLPALGILLGAFILMVALIGGWTGVRGLLALGASFLAILYLLLPGILAGYDPVVLAAIVASAIIVAGSYLTHGVNRTTSAAVLGMIATIVVTAGIAWWAVSATQLSGLGDENAAYLNIATDGNINFVGLLLGAMIIGILGILYDAAISQAVAVEELIRAAPESSRSHLFKRAMRIGREHIGALVNTLMIAYVGVSLPLLLLFQSYADEPFLITVNREIFATEIVRAIVGSIGIVLAVPIATLTAIWFLTRASSKTDTIEKYGNHHS